MTTTMGTQGVEEGRDGQNLKLNSSKINHGIQDVIFIRNPQNYSSQSPVQPETKEARSDSGSVAKSAKTAVD